MNTVLDSPEQVARMISKVVTGVVAVVTMGGVVFGWLRATTGSIWPVAIAHATVNTCLISSPLLVTDDPAKAAYLCGEGGLLTLLGVIAAWTLPGEPGG